MFHPLLHLGFALEFEQPAIVAEALAMASMHDIDPTATCEYLLRAEEDAQSLAKGPTKPLRALYKDIETLETLKGTEFGKSGDGWVNVAVNAFTEITRLGSQFKCSREQMRSTLLEMIDIVGKSLKLSNILYVYATDELRLRCFSSTRLKNRLHTPSLCESIDFIAKDDGSSLARAERLSPTF